MNPWGVYIIYKAVNFRDLKLQSYDLCLNGGNEFSRFLRNQDGFIH